ncbi:transcriptional regulator [Conexibacter sp. W3-3-2]|uniref:Transcriptional regulator n=1 Tax=Paraconexibacter algicola TaxID=2133960 RepID=A0A2T4UHB0_9ACTN|nr:MULTISPECIES: transcriptional regulator [Solirubrobacterales]MTD44843.1 transcriptional regulator [Conexibacter sp. W3-3-2]PTL58585.1 transcriptional regulator [Paraconexibacter algicola]
MSTPTALTPMTKVEVVLRGADVPSAVELLRAAGATGYTSINGVSGFGHDGYHGGRLLFNDTDALSLLIAVMPDDRAHAAIAGLRELFEDRPGVLFVSPTAVCRSEHFTAPA